MSHKQNKTMLYLGVTRIICMAGVAFLEPPETDTEKKWISGFENFPSQNIVELEFQTAEESFLLYEVKTLL